MSDIRRTLSCSVGNGPPPTRVVYALITPIVFPMRLGGIPRPVQTPPMVVEDEVTYGYVPKSMSSINAFAPSTRTFFPSDSALWMYTTLSTTYGRRRSARAYRTEKVVSAEFQVANGRVMLLSASEPMGPKSKHLNRDRRTKPSTTSIFTTDTNISACS